jgi:anti-sigma regulatory factor (Ser/Thr protein kinase)
VESIALAAEPASVGTARRFVSDLLVDRHLDPSRAVLLTSELVANVVRHARTDLTAAIQFDEAVRVEVHDGAAATEAFRELLVAAPTADPATLPGGRGLDLVRMMASRFGLADEPGIWNGKIVWFELDRADLGLRAPDRP